MQNQADTITVFTIILPHELSLPDVVHELTNSAWTALQKENIALDPHRWTSLHRAFVEVFKNRVRLHGGCGHTADCLAGKMPALFESPLLHTWTPWTLSDEPRVYLFEIRQDAERFVQSLTRMVTRIYLRRKACSKKKTQTACDVVLTGLHNVLSKYLFFSVRCKDCPSRKSFGERRIFGGAVSLRGDLRQDQKQ